jgi:predicted ribosomally synthesized peptide with nif11-like leader
MSLENARAFVRRVATDRKFADQLDAARDDERGKIALQAGYQFFQEEYEQIVEEFLASKELSDEELERVAGGTDGGSQRVIRPMYGLPSLG